MYDDYNFCLSWNDLGEDLISEKIDTYIDKMNGETRDSYLRDTEDMSDEDLKEVYKEMKEDLIDVSNEEKREEVERSLSAHFPVYFN